MNAITRQPLSDYLEALVKAGRLSLEIAETVNRLEGLEKQKRAVEGIRERLPELTEEVVQWLEDDHRKEDFYSYDGNVYVRRPWFFMSESLEYFLKNISYEFERQVLEKYQCPVCRKAVDESGQHRDCEQLHTIRNHCRYLESLAGGGAYGEAYVDETTKKRQQWEQALQKGQRPDGAPWNSPRPEEE